MVQWLGLCLPLLGAQVQFLVGKLGSCNPVKHAACLPSPLKKVRYAFKWEKELTICFQTSDKHIIYISSKRGVCILRRNSNGFKHCLQKGKEGFLQGHCAQWEARQYISWIAKVWTFQGIWRRVEYFRGFLGSSAGKEATCNVGDPGSIPGSGGSPGEGIGYLLQYSWFSLMAQLVKHQHNRCGV